MLLFAGTVTVEVSAARSNSPVTALTMLTVSVPLPERRIVIASSVSFTKVTYSIGSHMA